MSLRRNLGPAVLLIAIVFFGVMMVLGMNGHPLPRWLIDLTLVF